MTETQRTDRKYPPVLVRLQEEIDEYLRELLGDFRPSKYSDGKIIRDAVFGYQWFYPHEMSLIDTPLIQRLRGIHQTAFAYMVYPCAHHTRFEHSLGVAILAGKVTEMLDRPDDSLELRMAGLLHDCGHALFSHLSEDIMSHFFRSDLLAIRSSGYFGAKARIDLGEVLSYLMVKSPVFLETWDSIASLYPTLPVLDMDRVAGLIVGEADPEARYRADIISGPFDADKLDYFARDSHFTGISAELDIERLLYTVKVCEYPGEEGHLIMKRGSIPHLEQLLFGKMLLYSSIYHHHKVRAIECMVKALFDVIRQDPSGIKHERLRFQRITDFLRVSESELLVRASDEPRLRKLVQQILQRDSLKRAVMINASTMNKEEVQDRVAWFKFLSKGEDPNPTELRTIQEAIYSSLPTDVQTDPTELWLDLPRSVTLPSEAGKSRVELDPGEKPVSLHSIFPSDQWVDAYGDNKWTGHVFYNKDEDLRRRVADTAIDYLQNHDEFQLSFKPNAVENCFKE